MKNSQIHNRLHMVPSIGMSLQNPSTVSICTEVLADSSEKSTVRQNSDFRRKVVEIENETKHLLDHYRYQ